MTGLGYTYADESTAKLAHTLLQKVVAGRDVFSHAAILQDIYRHVRNLGETGITRMAAAAIDNAIWDLRARLLDLPLVKLFGMVRDGIPVYGSGGFTSYNDSQLQHQLGGWAQQGFSMVKMKVGSNPEDDPRRVEVARSAIGDQCELFVDANGAYTVTQALRLAQTSPSKKCDGWKSQSVPTISPGSAKCVLVRPSGWTLRPGSMATLPGISAG